MRVAEGFRPAPVRADGLRFAAHRWGGFFCQEWLAPFFDILKRSVLTNWHGKQSHHLA
jgi:hypothetical protein